MKNLIDKVVASVNPIKGVKRAQARETLKFFNSGYSEGGASSSKRSLKGFTGTSRSPEEDIDANLSTLVKRSRLLYMTSPIATSIIKTNKENVIGAGLRLKANIDYEFLGLTEDESEEWERTVEREFALWADTKECDFLNMKNFYEMQSIFFVSMLLNGDAFCLREYGPNNSMNPYELKLHLIESDRVSTPDNINVSHSYGLVEGLNLETNNRIVNGIEVDTNGKIVAYWISNNYPNELANIYKDQPKWVRIEAQGSETGLPNIIHCFESDRPGQKRGVPVLAPVIETLKQVTRYTDAELMSAVIGGMFTAFITSETTNEMAIGEATPDGWDNSNKGENDYQLGAGTINMLAPGESVQFANPSKPSSTFDSFVNTMCKQIGSAVGIPKEMLLKEFNNSYSASRAALLEAWKTFKNSRRLIADNFCQVIYEMFLTEAIAKGRIKAPEFFTNASKHKAWCGADWNGAAQGMLDPVKEVTAAKMRIEEGIATREEETIGLTGGNYKKNVKQLKHENELLKEAYGVNETQEQERQNNNNQKEVDEENAK